jgi:hypothetical protein
MAEESKQPPSHMNHWLSALAIGLAVTGVLTYIGMSHSGHANSPLGVASEKYIPAQTLRLLDGKMQEFGEFQITTNGGTILSLSDAENEPLIDYTAIPDAIALTIHQRLSESAHLASLTILMDREPGFSMFTPDGKHFLTPSKSWNQHSVVSELFHVVFPEKPEATLDEVVSSEDVRLVDRHHALLAVLGLSEVGEPTIALTHSDGSLLAFFSITGPISKPKEWPTLVLYDRHGSQRVEVDLGPDPAPAVIISEKYDPKNPSDSGTYALDPQSGKEVEISAGIFEPKAAAIPWLAHAMRRIPLPVALVDERGQVVWRTH